MNQKKRILVCEFFQETDTFNPILTEHIAPEHKYKVYASPMSAVSLDGERYVPTYVHRLLRRMSRDLRTRGKSPQMTIANWPFVIEGEAQWIEPPKTLI